MAMRRVPSKSMQGRANLRMRRDAVAMRKLNLAAALIFAATLAGCTASVSTFSASLSAPGADPRCDASVRSRATTSELRLAPGGGAKTTDERSDICLTR